MKGIKGKDKKGGEDNIGVKEVGMPGRKHAGGRAIEGRV